MAKIIKKQKTIWIKNPLVVKKWEEVKKQISSQKGVLLKNPQVLKILIDFYKNNKS